MDWSFALPPGTPWLHSGPDRQGSDPQGACAYVAGF
eukprot:COSAG04_NODE_9133_length_895_cov_0.670854_3_plen_35_part_01